MKAGQQFRVHIEACGPACERWADTQLDAPEVAAQEEAQEGAPQTSSGAEVVAEIAALVGSRRI